MGIRFGVGLALWCVQASPAVPACHDRPGTDAGAPTYVRHLSEDCSLPEREARAVPARELLHALKQGKGVDLSRIVVTGDLFLDDLPSVPVEQVDVLTPATRSELGGLAVTEVRFIGGQFSIRDSIVRGAVATRLRGGAVVVQGPLVMTGTSFYGIQDWSRTMFAAKVDWSDAHFDREALFVQARFLDHVRFRGTQFGPHTRFHRANFAAPVEFDDAVFHGLAELLEVTFRREASFARTRFEQGTGFSGSRFEQAAIFTGAWFEREVYFPFSEFRQSARFDGARFGGTAEFADAQFHGRADFTGAAFQQPPQWNRVTFRDEKVLPAPLTGSEDWLNYGIVIGAGLAALALFWVVLRR